MLQPKTKSLTFILLSSFGNIEISLTGGSQIGNSQVGGSSSSKLPSIIPLKEVKDYCHKLLCGLTQVNLGSWNSFSFNTLIVLCVCTSHPLP